LEPDPAVAADEVGKLLKAVREFDSYIRANAGRIPNYGERHRAGRPVTLRILYRSSSQAFTGCLTRTA
jgi:hypothetical protein